MDIKEEHVLPGDVDLQNETEFFTVKRNNDVTIKTEIKSEIPFIKHVGKLINYESTTCSNKWDINRETEIEEQTLVPDFNSHNERDILPENPVMKDNKYNVDYEIEIKEEPWWHGRETSTVCDDNIKDGDFPPVKCLRLCTETVSGDGGGKSPMSSAEVLGRDTSIHNGKDHLDFENQKIDVTELRTAEEQVLSEQFGKCIDEGEMYIRPLLLKQETFIPKGKSPHQCNFCNKIFTHVSSLKKHSLIHDGKKPHRCKTCDKRFTDLSNLKQHNLTHDGKKLHQCKTCNKKFTRLSSLKTHNLIHEGRKPHQCKTCDKGFTQLSHLKIHKLIHEGKKPYQCKTCDKSFAHPTNLKMHNLTHGSEKPHQCKTCKKSFTQMSNLKRHYLIHEGIKPHQCKTCNKRFTQMSTLKTHNLIHEGKKPHHCNTCNKSFIRMSTFKTHNLIHVGGEHQYTCNL